MNIRPVTGLPGDLPLLESIAQVLHQEWQKLPQWQTPEIILARLIKRMNGDNGEILFVATDKNGALAGTENLPYGKCRLVDRRDLHPARRPRSRSRQYTDTGSLCHRRRAPPGSTESLHAG